MEVYRLARKEFAGKLSGKGAALEGARWNSPGTEMVYTALNRSLCMAEVAVHLTLATLPHDYMMITIFIPDTVSMGIVQVKDLPGNWNSFPFRSSGQKLGDKFIHEMRFCLLKIPSAVTKGDFNILINPAHPEFKKIKTIHTEAFPFDRRIFK